MSNLPIYSLDDTENGSDTDDYTVSPGITLEPPDPALSQLYINSNTGNREYNTRWNNLLVRQLVRGQLDPKISDQLFEE